MLRKRGLLLQQLVDFGHIIELVHQFPLELLALQLIFGRYYLDQLDFKLSSFDSRILEANFISSELSWIYVYQEILEHFREVIKTLAHRMQWNGCTGC
jgi:hypothetical protein